MLLNLGFLDYFGLFLFIYLSWFIISLKHTNPDSLGLPFRDQQFRPV